jgi:uncharacterized membrane protein
MPPRVPRLTPGWAVASALALGVIALAASPPWLGFEGGAAVRHAFAPFCHQEVGRSPHVHGVPFALCHRCTGIVAGLAVGVLAGPLAPARLLDRLAGLSPLVVLGVAVVPTSIDWLLGVTGVLANTGPSRLGTGALFGIAAGLLLAVAFCAPRRAPLTNPLL